MSYTMSRDYVALWEALKHSDVLTRMTILNTDIYQMANATTMGCPRGFEACHREWSAVNLQWLAPVDLAAVLEAGDAIRRSYMDVQAFAIAHLPSRALDRFVDEHSPKIVTDDWTTATAKFRKQP